MIAQNYDHHDYGLPTCDDDSVASMRAQVQWFFESWTRAPRPPAGQQDSRIAIDLGIDKIDTPLKSPSAPSTVISFVRAPSGVDATAQGAVMERTPREKTYESLLRACVGQLRQWNVKYGNFQPSWLPPAGEVSLIETIEDWIGPSTQGVDHG